MATKLIKNTNKINTFTRKQKKYIDTKVKSEVKKRLPKPEPISFEGCLQYARLCTSLARKSLVEQNEVLQNS